MATSSDTHKLTRSPSAGLGTPQDEIPDTFSADEKYGHLEDLLRRTLSLAGEIAEDLSNQHLSGATTASFGHSRNCEEYIVLQKTPRIASEPKFHNRRQSSTSHRHRKIGPSDDSQGDSTSPSAASSMQEPLSPGSLAMSLDAIIEGKRSDIPLVKNPNLITDRLPESTSLSRATTSQTQASPQFPTPGSALDQDTMSQSAASAPIPIPGPPRSRPSASHRTSSLGLEDAPSRPHEWQVRVVSVSPKREPELSSSPLKTPSMPAFVKLEAVFPYRFFVDRHAAARWSGEGSYIIIGKLTVEDEEQSLLSPDECEREFAPPTERSLRDFVEDWEGTVNELRATEERESFMLCKSKQK